MKKQITVRYFAQFREKAGITGETLESDADTAAALFAQLKHRHGSAEPAGHCKVAINDRMADWDAPLNDGDVVLLFPPVAGG
jgi:molybdopterin synthase sulfur carrier subunit